MTAPVVVVTGASSGIGRAVAEAYVQGGARVVLGGRDDAKLRAVEAGLDAPARTAAIAGDIGDPRVADRLIATARERFGGLDIVVNSAGIFAARPFLDYTIDELDAFARTNLRGVVAVCQAAVRAFVALGRGGAIVNISAAIAVQPQAGLPASVPIAIKAGVNGLTRALALELAPAQIRVNAVAPGVIKTPLLRPRASYDDLAGAQPMGHVGEPRDVVDAVRYLASAPFVTGVVLAVDGGMTAGRW